MRLVRADKMNALDNAMFEALVDTGERLKTEKGVRAVVLSGEGRAFCAGLDMGNFGRMAEGPARPSAAHRRRRSPAPGAPTASPTARSTPCWVWREMPVPVIAAVHGVAFGGGFQLALGADMRYVAPDTRMAVMEIKWGLIPDMAGTQLMRHLAREDVVRELTYTGRIFSGEEALAIRLRHPRLRRSARRGPGDRPRDRRQEPRRDPRRQAPAERRGDHRPERGPDAGNRRAGGPDRLAQPGRGGDVQPAEARPGLHD